MAGGMEQPDPSTDTAEPGSLAASRSEAATLCLFGPPRLCRGVGAVPLPINRRSQLLGSLAVSGEWMPRGRLALLLWPDAAPGAARVNLRNLLLRLKRWLSEQGWPLMEERADALRWQGATDVQAFWQAVAREDWSAALDHGKGDLLAGLDASGADTWLDWLAAERERVDRAWRRAALAEADRLWGQPQARLALAERMLARDPCDEDAATLHVQALAVLHGDAAAQAAAQRFIDHLRRSLGAEPTWRWQTRDAASAQDRLVHPARPPRPWVDRPALEAALSQWIAGQESVLLLLGSPGAGKTALARHATAGLPVVWVWAAGAADTDALDLRLAAALGAGADAADQTRGQGRLVVIDEAEGVSGIEPWLQAQAARLPTQRLLVSSRRRLDCPGAQVLDVGPLTREEGRTLFHACVRRQAPAVDLDTQQTAVDAIVERLDGSPLAIELAASWVRHWPAPAVADALAEPLDMLGDDTLRASIDRSWQALSVQLQTALATLAWLPGPCTPDIALLAGGVTLPQLRALLDHSLLRGTADGGFEMHALVRARVRERVPSLREDVARKQLAAVSALCRQAWPATPPFLVVGPAAVQLEAAWDQAVQDRDADRLETLVDALRTRHGQHGALASGLARLRRALDRFGNDAGKAVQAALLAACADLLTRAQQLDEAQMQARAALRLARSLRRSDLARQAAHALGSTLIRQGDNARAWRCFAEAARLAQAIGDTVRAALALNAQGVALIGLNRLPEAAAACTSAIDQLARSDARPLALLGPWVNLAIVRRAQGDALGALAAATESVRLACAAGAGVTRAQTETQRALCHVALGNGPAALAAVQTARAACSDPAQQYALALVDLAEARAHILCGDARAAAALLHTRLSATALSSQASEVLVSLLEATAHWAARFGDAACADALARYAAAHPAFPMADRAGLQAWRLALQMPVAARRSGARWARTWTVAGSSGLQAAAAAAIAAIA
jgi:DNA-binding SARP family transcriptional activator/tetratricopeptide (TPR) repeat protein